MLRLEEKYICIRGEAVPSAVFTNFESLLLYLFRRMKGILGCQHNPLRVITIHIFSLFVEMVIKSGEEDIFVKQYGSVHRAAWTVCLTFLWGEGAGSTRLVSFSFSAGVMMYLLSAGRMAANFFSIIVSRIILSSQQSAKRWLIA